MCVREDKNYWNSCNFTEIPNISWESEASSCVTGTAIEAFRERVPRDNEPGNNLFAEQIHSSLNKYTFHHHSIETQ